jgi:hypothetical protein
VGTRARAFRLEPRRITAALRMIAKVFPFVKEKHRIRCFSFTIMSGRPWRPS